MDDSKKPIMVGVIIACLVGAGLITYVTRGGSDDLEELRGETQFMLCRNPQCKAEFNMDLAAYLEKISELQTGLQTPGVPCEKCSKNSAYAAAKCEKCSLVFEKGAAGIDKMSDTCPKCGFSAMLSKRAKPQAQ